MAPPILADAFGHHVWATNRLLDACARLDDAGLTTIVPGTYGSIIDTLRHVIDGDVFYLSVLEPGSVQAFDEVGSDIPTMLAVINANGVIWQRLIDADLDPTIDVVEIEDDRTETHAPLGIRLAQALHHGTDHRSQICTALTSLGIEPPAIDVWDFADFGGRLVQVRATGG
jgi:uncharacterized damage-inducible protein DinB